MRRLFVLLCLMSTPVLALESQPRVGLDHPFFAQLLQVQSFDCSRTTCKQIRSCEEACYKLLVCGHTQRDGDNDGIPCENLCSRRC